MWLSQLERPPFLVTAGLDPAVHDCRGKPGNDEVGVIERLEPIPRYERAIGRLFRRRRNAPNPASAEPRSARDAGSGTAAAFGSKS
jgi:hypothetical protein